MRRLLFVLGCALGALSVGCGDGGGGTDYEIAAGDLAGKIDGQAWTYQSASTNDFLSDDKGYFTTFLADKSDGCTGGGGTSMLEIIANIPKAVGEYPLGLTHNVTFANGTDNNVSTTGLLTVDKSDGMTIEGGLYAIFKDDPNFEVSGHFTATICPPSP